MYLNDDSTIFHFHLWIPYRFTALCIYLFTSYFTKGNGRSLLTIKFIAFYSSFNYEQFITFIQSVSFVKIQKQHRDVKSIVYWSVIKYERFVSISKENKLKPINSYELTGKKNLFCFTQWLVWIHMRIYNRKFVTLTLSL